MTERTGPPRGHMDLLDRPEIWRACVDRIPDMVLLVGRDGHVQYINHPAAGGTREAVVGRSALACIPEAAREELRASLRAILEGADERAPSVIHATDEANCYELHTGPVVVGDEVAAAVVVARDVTEQCRLEEQLRTSYKLDAVGQLAAGIAHDFSNVLTVIAGSAHMILQTIDEWHPLQTDVQAIVRAAERGTALTAQLLRFARREQAPAEDVDLNDVVRDIASLASRLIDHRITVTHRLERHGAPVYANRSQLEQVVMNLVLNARDAMRDGIGTIVISTHRTPATTTLRVTDNGVGMTDEVRRRIFEPFFTTRRGKGGTGLGLATVHAIVAHAGGSIEVASTPDDGSVFEIVFPAPENTARFPR